MAVRKVKKKQTNVKGKNRKVDVLEESPSEDFSQDSNSTSDSGEEMQEGHDSSDSDSDSQQTEESNKGFTDQNSEWLKPMKALKSGLLQESEEEDKIKEQIVRNHFSEIVIYRINERDVINDYQAEVEKVKQFIRNKKGENCEKSK
jgi:hypothetical protein